MKQKTAFNRSLFPLTIALILPLALPYSAARATITESNGGDRAIEFRDIFLGTLDDNYTEEQKNQLIFLPTPMLSNSTHKAATPEQFMSTLSEIQQKVDPLALYETGRTTPAHPYSREKLNDVLRAAGPAMSDRLTLIIVPGIFGEFIKTRAFEEIFSLKNSAFRNHWLKKVAEYREAHENGVVDKEALIDLSYSSQAVTQVKRKIEELVHVSSIDDANGTPLVNVVLMDTRFMSLESLGKLANRAELFSRRISKMNQILAYNGGSAPKNIAFMGYSRGTAIALEMLARAKEDPAKHSWISKTRAMISLGGVIYGSDLADDAMNVKGQNPPSAPAQQLAVLNEFKDQLELIDGRKHIAQLIVAGNLKKWGDFLARMVYVTNPPSSVVHSIFTWLGNENKSGWFMEKLEALMNGRDMAKRLDSAAGAQLATQMAYKSFNLKHPVTHNDPNVRRFQALTTAVVDGASELATPARLDWWKQNVVPTDGVKYYAITGTMMDDAGKGLQHDLATNRTAYNPELLDFGMLMGNYRDFVKTSGVTVNDSQVAVYKSRFWPQLHTLLNPEQPALDQSFLGVVGVHHWGLALKVVNIPDAKKVTVPHNPFPRRALLKALSTIVVKDLTGAKLEN